MKRIPRAIVESTTACKTVWKVIWPTGKTYFATTYPDSNLVFVETAAKRRPVSPLQATKLHQAIRAAIAACISSGIRP